MEKKIVQRSVNSIEFFLNPKILVNGELERQIKDHLLKGDLVVIRNALETVFAERMYACLDQFSDWKVYEGYKGHFHYHHHNIYDDELFPPDLLLFRAIFVSHSINHFIKRL